MEGEIPESPRLGLEGKPKFGVGVGVCGSRSESGPQHAAIDNNQQFGESATLSTALTLVRELGTRF